jgi:hypothetical protein
MKPTLFSEKALTEKANKLYDQGKIYDAPSYKQGYEACKEDLRAWLKGASPLLKPLKSHQNYQYMTGYYNGQEAMKEKLLAELSDSGVGHQAPLRGSASTSRPQHHPKKEAGR